MRILNRLTRFLGLHLLLLTLIASVGCGGPDNGAADRPSAPLGKGDTLVDAHPFSPYLDICGYAQGRWCGRLHQIASEGTRLARERLAPDWTAQYRTSRQIPGHLTNTTVVYGVVTVPPEVAAALVTDYEAIGPHIFSNSGGRLVANSAKKLNAPSRQAVIRYSGMVAYALRQGLSRYQTDYGEAFQVDWESVSPKDGGEPAMDIRGSARFEPFQGPNGERYTLFRYDSFTALTKRRSDSAAKSFATHPWDDPFWFEGELQRVAVPGMIAQVAKSFTRYIETLVDVEESKISEAVMRLVQSGGAGLPSALDRRGYLDARVSALQWALLSSSCVAASCSLIWDYDPSKE